MNPQYVISIALRRHSVDSFNRYPFSLPAVQALH